MTGNFSSEASHLNVQGEYVRHIRYHLLGPLSAACVTETLLLYMNYAGAVAEDC